MIGVEILYWHWLAIAALLGVVELLTMTLAFLGFALAAAILGGCLYFLPNLSLSTDVQLLAFAVIGLGGYMVIRHFFHQPKQRIISSKVNRRLEQMIGQTVILETPILQGRGHVQIGDSSWLVQGTDLPKGAKVRIVGIDGTTLVVTAFDTVTD
jgi:inner membrane protein